MKLALITDAWQPQMNGVVTTLVELVRELVAVGHEVDVIHPGRFDTRPCPGYPGLDVAMWPTRKLGSILKESRPDAIHLATEGPLGWSARRHCLRHRLPFTTSCHLHLPDLLKATWQIPVSWGHALLRWFHSPSAGVMVPRHSEVVALEARGYRKVRQWSHGVDTRVFGFEPRPVHTDLLGNIPRPIALYVGRLSPDKRVDEFLSLELPGSKVVCGVGPLEMELKDRFPHAHWLGLLSRSDLARVYASADVLVYPGQPDSFGLVMLEAMACGTPVACLRTDPPHDILKNGQGCAMADDLREAALRALAVPRHHARVRALHFNWAQASKEFVAHLVQTQEQKSQYRKAVRREKSSNFLNTATDLSPVGHTSGK